jgi:hypothetical protein
MPEEAAVRHFQTTADIRRLVLVQKQIGLRRVRLDAVPALPEAQRDQNVEKVASGTAMRANPPGKSLQILRTPGQLCEYFHFNGA